MASATAIKRNNAIGSLDFQRHFAHHELFPCVGADSLKPQRTESHMLEMMTFNLVKNFFINNPLLIKHQQRINNLILLPNHLGRPHNAHAGFGGEFTL